MQGMLILPKELFKISLRVLLWNISTGYFNHFEQIGKTGGGTI